MLFPSPPAFPPPSTSSLCLNKMKRAPEEDPEFT